MLFVFQQKESMMLNRTLLLSVFTAAVFALLFVSASPSAVADEKNITGEKFTFDVGGVIILGQSQNGAQRNSTFVDRTRQWWNRLLQDDIQDNDSTTQRPVSVVVPPAIPMTPPRPLTHGEIRQAQTPSQGSRTGAGAGVATGTANTSAPRGAAPSGSRNNADERSDENEISAHDRLRILRERSFDRATLEEAAQAARRTSNIPPTNLVPFQDNRLPPAGIEDNPRGAVGGFNDFPDPPAGSARTLIIDEVIPEVSLPRHMANQHASPRNDWEMPPLGVSNTSIQNPHVPNQAVAPSAPPRHSAHQNVALHTEEQRQTVRQVLVSTSPRLMLEVEPPDNVVIGQEVNYLIRITNIGDAPAEGVVVDTEIPPWIDIRHKDTNDGGLVDHRREDGSGKTDLVWKINRMNPGVTNTLVLGLVPQQRLPIELPIRHDFARPTILTTVNVREAKLEMEIIGVDEVLWNEEVTYKLLVRNVGNGDAENVRLDLLQSAAGETFYEFREPLRPDETHALDIKVKAGREREHIDIAVVAKGSHDVRAEIQRRLRVLRPRLEMSVHTLPLHFVDNPAEISVRIRNAGNADAENVTIRADLPLGMEYKSSNEGGNFSIQQQQRFVEWRGKTIARGEMQTFTLVCEPRREGNSRVSVEATEPGGDVLAAGHSAFMTEAIVDLDLAVLAPRGPIELGQEVKYEIQVTNSGTKSAENVEILILFGHQFTPTSTQGESKASVTDDGQVAFEKIPAILPRQSVTVNVIVKAEGIGIVPIRAEVIRSDTGGAPISLQKGLSAHIFSRTATAPGQSQNETFR